MFADGEVPAAVTIEPELSIGELTYVWTPGVGSERSPGRPKEWNGESSGFADFAFKLSNWLSGLPRLLEESANMGQPILWETLAAQEKVVARGVATDPELYPTSS